MRGTAIIVLAALTACARTEPVDETPDADVEVNLATPELPPADGAAENEAAAGPSDGEPASGEWVTRSGPEGAWAGYGPPNSEALFSVSCDRSTVVFTKADVPPSGAGPTDMTLTATDVKQSVPAVSSDVGMPNTRAAVPANADWLSTLAASSGNLTISIGGGEPLVVPIAEPMTSTIKDCGR